jgi:hypothetical protein
MEADERLAAGCDYAAIGCEFAETVNQFVTLLLHSALMNG